MTETRSRRRTKAQIQEQRQLDWTKLVHAHSGTYICRWCGELKYCRAEKSKRRMACEECFIAKGPPKIPRASVEAATLPGGNQPEGGTS